MAHDNSTERLRNAGRIPRETLDYLRDVKVAEWNVDHSLSGIVRKIAIPMILVQTIFLLMLQRNHGVRYLPFYVVMFFFLGFNVLSRKRAVQRELKRLGGALQ